MRGAFDKHRKPQAPTPPNAKVRNRQVIGIGRVAVISAKKHKRQRRKRQSVTAKREKSQTPKFITGIHT